MGKNATPEKVKEVVSKAVEHGNAIPNSNTDEKDGGKVILTSFGMNHPGIIAEVTKKLSEANVDITDLSQKLMGDFYTMIIMLDITNSSKELSELQSELNTVGEQLKIKIYLQHEDLFRYMHRV